MIFTKFTLNNKVSVLFILFVIFVGGIGTYFNLGKLEDPDFTIKTALVVTAYPGASPHEVEQQVTRKIEEAVQTADEVEKIRSVSRAGVSLVYVDLYENAGSDKIEQLWDILRRRVSGVQSELPKGVIPSQVMDDYGDVFGIFFALTGDGLEARELKKYAKYIKRELLLVKDVEKIIFVGEEEESISIYINPLQSASHGINPGKIIDVIQSQNSMAISGKLETHSKRIRISQNGVFKSIEEIGDLVIQADAKSQIRLKDIAEIKRDYTDPPSSLMRFNGKSSIGIGISVKANGNVVEMGDAVRKRIDELLEELPLGIKIEGIYYQSEFVKESIKKFMSNLLQSVGIVVLVLLLSMGLRSGFIIASNLIFSILGTFIVMIIIGINLQQISLAALILVMGMVVDNAIVITEGSLTMLQSGKNRMDSILTPPTNTAMPLLGATIIAALAFMPIYFAPNNTGEFVGSLSVVVAISLLLSWFFSMTQTPIFCYYLLKAPKKSTTESQEGLVYRLYKKALDISLKNRALTLGVLIILLIAGVAGFGSVKQNFFAESEKKQFFLDYRKPEDSKIDSVLKDMKKFESYLKNKKKVVNYTVCIGTSAPRFASSITPEAPNNAFAQVVINVTDSKHIDKLIDEINIWFNQNLQAGVPHMWKYISGPKSDYRVEARITGRDPKVLRDLSRQIQTVMERNKNSQSVTDDWKERVMALNLDYSQIRGQKGGVSKFDLSMALLATTDGIPISAYKEGNELLPVKFKYKNIAPENIDGVPVWGKSDRSIPLSQITKKGEITWEDPIIRRYNRKRVIRAQCDPVKGVTATTLLKEIRPEVEKLKLPKGYKIEWEGEYELSESGNKGVQKYLPVCLLFMVIILVFLFNSVKQPLIIILVLPFSIIGITGGLLLMDSPFGFLAILGTYSLAGMLIKNAIVLIDEINSLIDSGMIPFDAVESACFNRMRPVLLTSLTTILGMIPLLRDPLFESMATTIMFGLMVATILTLILIPVLYTIFYRITPLDRETI